MAAVLGASRAELLPVLVWPVSGAETLQAAWDAGCAVAVGGRVMLFCWVLFLSCSFRGEMLR